MSQWQKPEFEEVAMNAEIGAYQEDYGPAPDPTPDARVAPENKERKEVGEKRRE